MTTSSFQFGIAGSSPFVLDGPAVAGSGVPLPQIKPGTVTYGDNEGEFVYCKLTLGSTTTLTDGQVYQYDKDYNASLLTTAAAVRGQSVGVARVAQANVPAGTYYVWLQRAGHVAVQANASAPANQLCETTATGGQINAAASPTVSSKAIQGLFLLTANGGSAGTTEANVLWPYVDKTN
jgi:hypothetical protein